MTDDGALAGPVGAPGAGETLTSLPWFWTYLIGRIRLVKSVEKACAARGLPPPDPATVDYADHAAVARYLEDGQEDNVAFESEMAAMLAQRSRRR